MNAEQCTDAVTALLASRVRPAVSFLANEVADDVRQSISIPDGGTKSKPIHSKPGEPPRRETGEYRGSWTVSDSESGDRFTGTVGTAHFLGPILEISMNRPHARPAADRARPEAAERIKSNL